MQKSISIKSKSFKSIIFISMMMANIFACSKAAGTAATDNGFLDFLKKYPEASNAEKSLKATIFKLKTQNYTVAFSAHTPLKQGDFQCIREHLGVEHYMVSYAKNTSYYLDKPASDSGTIAAINGNIANAKAQGFKLMSFYLYYMGLIGSESNFWRDFGIFNAVIDTHNISTVVIGMQKYLANEIKVELPRVDKDLSYIAQKAKCETQRSCGVLFVIKPELTFPPDTPYDWSENSGNFFTYSKFRPATEDGIFDPLPHLPASWNDEPQAGSLVSSMSSCNLTVGIHVFAKNVVK